MKLHRIAPYLLVAFLVACGGGGGGGSDGDDATIAVTLSATELTGTWLERDGHVQTVVADIPDLPDETVYPVVVESAADPVLRSVQVEQIDRDSFSAELQFSGAAGARKGSLALRLCKDAQCTSEYELTGATLPYAFTIDPIIRVTTRINGVLQTADQSVATDMDSASFDIPSGAVVELSSNIPVSQWVSDLNGQSATVTTLASTATTWRGTVSGGEGNLTGITVSGVPVDADLNPAAVNFFIRTPQP